MVLQGVNLFGSRGKRDVFLMLLRPKKSIQTRSRPAWNKEVGIIILPWGDVIQSLKFT